MIPIIHNGIRAYFFNVLDNAFTSIKKTVVSVASEWLVFIYIFLFFFYVFGFVIIVILNHFYTAVSTV